MRMFAPDRACKSVQTDRGVYENDRAGFIRVEDRRDVRALRDAGYVPAGATPKVARHWVCDCGWEALINHCPKCDSSDLTRREGR